MGVGGRLLLAAIPTREDNREQLLSSRAEAQKQMRLHPSKPAFLTVLVF